MKQSQSALSFPILTLVVLSQSKDFLYVLNSILQIIRTWKKFIDYVVLQVKTTLMAGVIDETLRSKADEIKRKLQVLMTRARLSFSPSCSLDLVKGIHIGCSTTVKIQYFL